MERQGPAQQFPAIHRERRVVDLKPGAVRVAQFQVRQPRRQRQQAAQAGQPHLPAACLLDPANDESAPALSVGGQKQHDYQGDGQHKHKPELVQ